MSWILFIFWPGINLLLGFSWDVCHKHDPRFYGGTTGPKWQSAFFFGWYAYLRKVGRYDERTVVK